MIVLPIDATRASLWREMEGLEDVVTLADPARSLSRALGAGRPRVPLWMFRPRDLLAGLAALGGGRRPRITSGDDGLQLGVDAVVAADGEVVVLHRARSASDRLPPAELVRRVEALA